MGGVQIAFPFDPKRARRNDSGVELIGHSYAEDDQITVTVIGLCESTEGRRVILKRRPGGVVSMPVWLARSILREEKKEGKRAA